MPMPHQKLHLKPNGENISLIKEYISTAFCFAHVASSKTLCEKPSSKNSQREKEYNMKPSCYTILYNYYSS
jgi:hypothetical protein